MRHRQRHLHATIVAHLRAALTAGGWFADPPPFAGIPGMVPVTLIDYEPQGAGETPAMNTVSVSIGDQGQDEAFELGAGLSSCVYTLFVDVYPVRESVGVALADDIKDALTHTLLPLRDFTTNADGAVTEHTIEFEDVVVEVIPTATTTLDKRSWRAVKATATLFYLETVEEEPELWRTVALTDLIEWDVEEDIILDGQGDPWGSLVPVSEIGYGPGQGDATFIEVTDISLTPSDDYELPPTFAAFVVLVLVTEDTNDSPGLVGNYIQLAPNQYLQTIIDLLADSYGYTVEIVARGVALTVGAEAFTITEI